MLSALKYSHSFGIIHRYITLNCLVYDSYEENCLKIIDWGLN